MARKRRAKSSRGPGRRGGRRRAIGAGGGSRWRGLPLGPRGARASRRPRGRYGGAQEGEAEQFGYAKATDGKAINWMVVEKSAVIKFDKHVASRVFSPDELENLDSYMRKYRKYGIVELLDNKLDGVRVSVAV